MENNMTLYNKVRAVPQEAQKTIGGGRLKGMTDINPMWRIQTLTENFGVVGVGWKYEIVEKKITEGADGCMCAFVDINLYLKIDGEWSEAIPGTGGSMFVSAENSRLHTNDECFKMALTDALSVACKALGVGADIYWSSGRTKYSGNSGGELATDIEKKKFKDLCKALNLDYRDVLKQVGVTGQMTKEQYAKALKILQAESEKK